ncbi:MAG TPA: hypothetical protein VN843_10310 [Anaerolineales bacterium]|nr:hypothetical protein [Anaerolineales bacterium]
MATKADTAFSWLAASVIMGLADNTQRRWERSVGETPTFGSECKVENVPLTCGRATTFTM